MKRTFSLYLTKIILLNTLFCASVYAIDVGYYVISGMRILCTPIRYAIAPYYQLAVPTEKRLNKIAILESLLIQNRKNLSDPSFLAFYSETLLPVQAKLNVKLYQDAIQHDSLTVAEKIFTDRQQQWDAHMRATVKRYQDAYQKASEFRIS